MRLKLVYANLRYKRGKLKLKTECWSGREMEEWSLEYWNDGFFLFKDSMMKR